MVLQRYLTEYGLDVADLTCGLACGVGYAWPNEDVPIVFGCCDAWVADNLMVDACTDAQGDPVICSLQECLTIADPTKYKGTDMVSATISHLKFPAAAFSS